jgi:hypothetical protein
MFDRAFRIKCSVVIAWGVFLPMLGKEKGVGNRYIPLRSLRVGTCEVCSIHTDNSNGLLCAADVRGNVCIWEVFDETQNLGACSRLRRAKTTAQFKAAINLASQMSGEDASEDVVEEDIESSFLPTTIREVLPCRLS